MTPPPSPSRPPGAPGAPCAPCGPVAPLGPAGPAADGAPRAAAGLLLRALNEPPPNELRGAVLGELGQAETLAHEPAAAEHLRGALEISAGSAARVPLGCALGELLIWRGQPLQAHTLLGRLIEELGEHRIPRCGPRSRRSGPPAPRWTSAWSERSSHACRSSTSWRWRPVRRDARCRSSRLAGGHSGDRTRAIGASCSIGPSKVAVRCRAHSRIGDGQLCDRRAGLADEVTAAEAMLSDIRADARARGSIHAHLTALTWGSLLALRRGKLPDAESDARMALELARRHGMVWALTWVSAFLGQALLERGALAGCTGKTCYLNRVKRGEALVVTEHGRRVARLIRFTASGYAEIAALRRYDADRTARAHGRSNSTRALALLATTTACRRGHHARLPTWCGRLWAHVRLPAICGLVG